MIIKLLQASFSALLPLQKTNNLLNNFLKAFSSFSFTLAQRCTPLTSRFYVKNAPETVVTEDKK